MSFDYNYDNKNCIILYKNNKVKVMSLDKLLSKDKWIEKVEIIFIPYLYRATYIPIKPHKLLYGKNFRIYINLSGHYLDPYDTDEVMIRDNILSIDKEFDNPIDAIRELFIIIKLANFNDLMINMSDCMETSYGIAPDKCIFTYKIDEEEEVLIDSKLDISEFYDEDNSIIDIYSMNKYMCSYLSDIFFSFYATDKKEISLYNSKVVSITYDSSSMYYEMKKYSKIQDEDIILNLNSVFVYHSLEHGYECNRCNIFKDNINMDILFVDEDDKDIENYKAMDNYERLTEYEINGFSNLSSYIIFNMPCTSHFIRDLSKDIDEFIKYCLFYLELSSQTHVILYASRGSRYPSESDDQVILIDEEIDYIALRSLI